MTPQQRKKLEIHTESLWRTRYSYPSTEVLLERLKKILTPEESAALERLQAGKRVPSAIVAALMKKIKEIGDDADGR